MLNEEYILDFEGIKIIWRNFFYFLM